MTALPNEDGKKIYVFIVEDTEFAMWLFKAADIKDPVAYGLIFEDKTRKDIKQALENL